MRQAATPVFEPVVSRVEELYVRRAKNDDATPTETTNLRGKAHKRTRKEKTR